MLLAHMISFVYVHVMYAAKVHVPTPSIVTSPIDPVETGMYTLSRDI